MNIPVTAVVAGDVIIRSDTEITVTLVERLTPSPTTDIVRIHGRITKGYGRSSKVHTWTHFADQEVDVDRGEERYVFNRAGRAVRVR